MSGYFDNTYFMGRIAAVHQVVRKLQFEGAEVIKVIVGAKLTRIQIGQCGSVRVEKEEGGWGYQDRGDIRICWQLPVVLESEGAEGVAHAE